MDRLHLKLELGGNFSLFNLSERRVLDRQARYQQRVQSQIRPAHFQVRWEDPLKNYGREDGIVLDPEQAEQSLQHTVTYWQSWLEKSENRMAAWGIFTDPELAHAGLTEEEARSLYGEKISVYRQRFQNIDRGKTDGEEIGISKFICDPKGRLLGAHIFGKRACEIIHEAQLVKALNLPFRKIQSVIHVYPSYSDVIKQPAKEAYIESLRKNPFISLLQRTIVKK